MARLLLLTDARGASVEVLPALGLLGHRVRVLPTEPQALVDPPECDVVLLDARRDLANARGLTRVLRTTGLSTPLIAIFTEGGLTALTSEWQLDDVLLESAGPAEVEARIRLAMTRTTPQAEDEPTRILAGELTIDEDAYSARIRSRALDLTYKEFELLKHLAQHPGRVFTRAQLLQEVWGYDYFGGTRTVDVHVRRLRAKLGPDNESLIGTVRNVGYRFVGAHELRAPEEQIAPA
ncbi:MULTISPECIES: response regulator transcription factor [unclassified Allobranchiibius]|uniref:winged helix-turn-helix transcriptional regulator n=1 Tax=unclassified Allobranchiibius TaxID=2649857 RepID=UPI001AA11B87|nr:MULTISPECIES: response regulator transcription factor [unclassified Allobranchiibius]MBO1767029.1 response regulator transcription factor [Allobranchiibius sp. GilTou38]UIJ35963.1 response regulator transcription factor [Allobranchiibius sp. GilTou73]